MNRLITLLTLLSLFTLVPPSLAIETTMPPSIQIASDSLEVKELAVTHPPKPTYSAPEPSVVLLIGVGIAMALTWFRRRRRFY